MHDPFLKSVLVGAVGLGSESCDQGSMPIVVVFSFFSPELE